MLVPGVPGYVPMRERQHMTWARADGTENPDWWEVEGKKDVREEEVAHARTAPTLMDDEEFVCFSSLRCRVLFIDIVSAPTRDHPAESKLNRRRADPTFGTPLLPQPPGLQTVLTPAPACAVYIRPARTAQRAYGRSRRYRHRHPDAGSAMARRDGDR